MELKKEFQAIKELMEKDILDVIMKLDTIDEAEDKELCLTIMTYFLQKRQKEVIKEGLF
ncbi:MAG: hypothetical protein LBL98_00595 [Ruminococcus sp.]|jgi:hypothetical protein|nr:hypothetical protein [Ruminococcus sp.]